MDVDCSVCKCYCFDVWLSISGYNKNNHRKKPSILSKFKFAQDECWSDSLEPYPSFGSLALDANGGGGFWDFVRNGYEPTEALHIGSIKRSEGWNLCWDFYCDQFLDYGILSMDQIQRTLNIDRDGLDLG